MSNVTFFKASDTSSETPSDNIGVKIESELWNNVKINDELVIEFGDTKNNVMLQAYKCIEGEKNIIQTINTFNSENKNNFYYNTNIVDMTNNARIINEYTLYFLENEQGLYESDVINKSDFVDINSITT